MSKMIPANGRLLKPANRQVYRYNLTSGEHFENSGKKERGGAGCGCDPVANRVFWEGGSSNSGLSDNVEVWGVDPLHRGGEPIFKADTSLRDVGATACGGYFVGTKKNEIRLNLLVNLRTCLRWSELFFSLNLQSCIFYILNLFLIF